ncbi:MAG: hypothetical protein AVDCRST_MAG64-3463, partial [uncultured Phycisphaerae bacterium]
AAAPQARAAGYRSPCHPSGAGRPLGRAGRRVGPRGRAAGPRVQAARRRGRRGSAATVAGRPAARAR